MHSNSNIRKPFLYHMHINTNANNTCKHLFELIERKRIVFVRKFVHIRSNYLIYNTKSFYSKNIRDSSCRIIKLGYVQYVHRYFIFSFLYLLTVTLCTFHRIKKKFHIAILHENINVSIFHCVSQFHLSSTPLK